MLQSQPTTHTGLWQTLLVIVGAVVLVFFVLLPGQRQARANRTTLLDAQSEQMELERLYSRAKTVSQTLRTIDAESRARLGQIFAVQPDLGTYGQLLNSLASANNFVLTSISVGDNSKNESMAGLSEIQLTVQLKGGGYKDLKNLLADVTRAVPLIEVSSLTYSPESAVLALNLISYAVKDGLPLPATLDTTLLKDPRLLMLRAPVVPTQPPPAGRENPFAPLTTP